MLHTLEIENVAVIERASLELGEGLNVLTGETGAGKSIVIDSLGAILGDRVSRELVRRGAQKAHVTAVFDSPADSAWFEENDVEPEDTVIIKRRITADGKSAATVNGVTVSAAQLRQLTAQLLDIHGQNDGRQLTDESRHGEYLDAYGGLGGILSEYADAYTAYREAESALAKLCVGESEKRDMEDLLRLRVGELESAKLRVGEEDELSAKRDLMRNAGRLKEALDKAYDALYGRNFSACDGLGTAVGELGSAATLAEELAEIRDLVQEARYMAEDAAERVRDICAGLDFSDREYDELEERTAKLRGLRKKYGTDEEGLIKLLEESREKLDSLQYSEKAREEAEQRVERNRAKAWSVALKLRKAREKVAVSLRSKVEEGLVELSMPSVRFEVELVSLEKNELRARGADEVRFLMSANAGETPGRISKIASGGELSRIMLVLKDVLSERDGVGTMVFDEVDEGVSGIAAQRVGEKLARLSGEKQVVCVTHLSQIAAMADIHFNIVKAEREERTYTSVDALDTEGRVRELARLHGGENVTLTTLASAAEQLEAADGYKIKLRG